MFLTVIGMFFNIWTLLLILGVAGLAATIYFIPPPFGGPAKLLHEALNPMTWLGIAGALALIAFLHSAKTIEKQQQTIQTQQSTNTAQSDGIAVLTDNTVKQEKAKQATTRLRAAIEKAPQGDEIDAIMDQIAREQCAVADPKLRPDCVRNH